MEQEYLPPEKKKNKSFKKISDWAGLLRNFATIVASFISLITLFILIRQNERTYQPDLILTPDQSIFCVRYRTNPTSCDDIRLGSVADSTPLTVKLTAMNIGLGAAKDLHVSWQFDPKKMADTLSIGVMTIFTKAQYNDDLMALLFEHCFLQGPLEQHAEFCLPVNTEKTPVQISLPETYLMAWNNILIRICHNPSIPFEQRKEALLAYLSKFQDLQAKLTYTDINDRSYSKIYQVQIVPAFIDLVKQEMIITWNVTEKARYSTPRKQVITVKTEDGSNIIATLHL